MNPNDTSDESVTTVQALQWARVLQVVQKHGVAGLIIVLLFYQMGIFASAQTYGCGL